MRRRLDGVSKSGGAGLAGAGAENHARVKLRVAPGAARSAVVGRHGAAWKVRVNAAPEDGKANAAVVRLLATTLALPVRDVEIVSGHTSRDKTVALTGIDHDEIERRLEQASADGKDPE